MYCTMCCNIFQCLFSFIDKIFPWRNKFGKLKVFSELINISVSETCLYLKFELLTQSKK